MSTLRLRGGRVIDPVHPGSGELRDLGVRDGRIVALPPDAPVDQEIDARGCLVMAGGIDLHSHIGGGKVNLARLLLPELQRREAEAARGRPANPLEWPSCGGCAPGTLATGYRYAEMGYTAAFEPAMSAGNARQAHLEMGDVPILDHGAYVMLGNDELLLRLLHDGAPPELLRDAVGHTVAATRAMGVKVVNPGGISAFKFNQRRLDVDEAHVHWGVTPRRIVQALARAVHELGLAHPLHIHASNLGVAGNIGSTLATIDALEGLRGHLTHVQFHAYGDDGPKKFSSAALRLAEKVNATPNVSIDVGQVLFGQTVTASGDTMRQFAQSGFAHPRKSVIADLECDAGCGVVPFRYREPSYVNALQWSIGLELFLQCRDPWRIVLTTDHPNGAPFTSYPHLIRLLMDKDFRDAQLARLHPDVAAQSALRDIRRELTLDEVAILTRAGPARLLGLADRGHLGPGAVADVAVYREAADPEATFSRAAWLLKDGRPVVRDGQVIDTPAGGVHFATPAYDEAAGEALPERAGGYLAETLRLQPIGHDELCACCHGARLLPSACEARPL
ncbi:formylmethanofuran dehydrogenase subunit A [Piscinibacter sakaiensis]|uniref:Formylmethanofuran dehydrogenase, subunit A n=1 Tax=Piscinibacter sakaiensis TaxID=1547922 RepID=A0A0K8P507_PISS1|nr:formylmethanofuran dehydrogenase subunit A [Piscinibacter sakaiensis]GAP37727.1 formylmethanofuran dehydrogenase, subunit A [Piscinibacter sakaiensis]